MTETENSRQTILHHALAFFSRCGYDSVSVSQIVQAAGITKPTLYYFFGSKEGLFQALLETHYPVLLNALGGASVYVQRPEDYFNDVYPVLLRTAAACFDFARQNPLFYVLMRTLSFSPPQAKQTEIDSPFRTAHNRIITDMFYAFSKAHGNLSGKEELLARKFTAVVNEEITFRLNAPVQKGQSVNSGEELSQLVHTFMHGIFA